MASELKPWKYEIKYGPEGENAYSWVYDDHGAMVATMKTHKAREVVDRMNTPVAPVSPDATGKCGELETAINKAEKELLERIADTYGDSVANDIADYLGRIGDAARSQAEELLAAKDAEREAIMQAITDPENQPSKFGTVTIAFFNEKIAAKNARIKALEQVNAKLCDDAIDYELKIAERDVSLNELKQKLADKFSFTSDDDALAVLERYGHKETGNGIIKADMRSLDDMCRAAVAYLCAEWDFVFQDEVELNRETLGAKLAAAVKALEEADEALQADAIASAHAAIRAVLGGKL